MLHAEISVNMDKKIKIIIWIALWLLNYLTTLSAKLIQASFSIPEKQVKAPSVTAPSSDCTQKYIQNHLNER